MWLVAIAVAAGLLGVMATNSLMRRWRNHAGNRMLVATSAAHITNDACFAVMYPLLPFIAADLHLSYAQVGLIKTVFSGTSSAFQAPASLVGEKLGEYLVLLGGNLWVGLGLGVMALAFNFPLLLAAAALAGFGGSAQHPIAPALVSRAFETNAVAANGPATANRRPAAGSMQLSTALGTLNFTGDLGKLVGPLLVGLAAPTLGWQMVLVAIGVLTAVTSIGLLWRRDLVAPPEPTVGIDADVGPAPPTKPPNDASPGANGAGGSSKLLGFGVLLAAGALDNATRSAALTFLPFRFQDQGLDPAAVSALLGVILAAGAAGKFVCGWLSGRLGVPVMIVLTEIATAAALLAFLVAPPLALVPLGIIFGFALNGTSSAFSTAVARLAPSHLRTRAYGVYFTAALIGGAVSPLVYGAIGDVAGLSTAFVALAIGTMLVVPLVEPIRQALR